MGRTEEVVRVQLGPERDLLRAVPRHASGEWEHIVADLLPTGFPRYLRVFHPFLPADPADPKRNLAGPAMTWRVLADRARVKYHSEMSSSSLNRALGGAHEEHRPFWLHEGRLHDPSRAALFRQLAVWRITDAYFLFDLGVVVRGHPPLLYQASVADFARVQTMANEEIGEDDDYSAPGPEYVWPLDRAWIVNTDYDLESTYVACDDRLADAILGDPSIEALPVSLESRIDNGVPRIDLDDLGGARDSTQARRAEQ